MFSPSDYSRDKSLYKRETTTDKIHFNYSNQTSYGKEIAFNGNGDYGSLLP